MPEWITPELRPVWWRASPSSFSSTTTRAPGTRTPKRHAVARPTMPPPTTARSALRTAWSARREARRHGRRAEPREPRGLGGHVVLREHVGALPRGQGFAVAQVLEEAQRDLREVLLVRDAQGVRDGDPQLAALLHDAHAGVARLQCRDLV